MIFFIELEKQLRSGQLDYCTTPHLDDSFKRLKKRGYIKWKNTLEYYKIYVLKK